MKTLLQGGKVLTLDGKERYYEKGDVLFEDGKILDVGEKLSTEGAQVVDCRGHLVMPGLVNAHLHSDENLFRGLFDNLPLEIWMLYSCPVLQYGPFSERLIYLRTMLGAIEMVKSGITSVQDDVSESPVGTVGGYNQVFKAYEDIGLRANVAMNQPTRTYVDKLPYVREIIPTEIQKEFGPASDGSGNLALYEEIIRTWNGRSNVKVVVSTSAPQRCSDEYLQKAYAMAERYDLPFHTHTLETKTQRVTGYEFYGKTIIGHIKDLGLLTDRTTIIHCIWVDDDDIEMMGQARVNVAHNPVSNLKLGSGIMPWYKLKKAGANVVLGTDGVSSNDSQSIFEGMKLAALLHKVSTPDFRQWPTSADALAMATTNAAKSLRRSEEIASLEAGKRADIVVLDASTPAFTPFNDVKNHLVYCENGSSVRKVYVDGRLVVLDGKVLTVDEKALLDELRSLMPEFQAKFRETAKVNDRLFSSLEDMYWRCMNQNVSLNRFSSQDLHL